MAASKVLPRLLRLRELQEEQSRLELESSVGTRNRVVQQLDFLRGLQQQGRERFATAVYRSAAAERIGATIELAQTGTQRSQTEEMLVEAESEVERRREEFLARRTSRQQVETLVEQAAAAAREQASRRAQQMLDDWYGRKLVQASTPGLKQPASKPAKH